MFYIVGMTSTCKRLAVCASATEASRHIDTLPDHEDGRYYIDDCRKTVVLSDPIDHTPAADDLIEAAQELRDHADEWRAGNFDADFIDNAARLLEQVAITLLPDGAQRDELLEGRTDLGQPAVTVDESYGPDGRPLTFGRCDTCGDPCDKQGCTTDRSHDVALGE